VSQRPRHINYAYKIADVLQNIGLIFSAVVENSTTTRNDTGSYRIPCAVQILFAILLSSGMILLPETPRYLIKKGQTEKAAKAMGVFRGLSKDHPEVLAEIQEILDSLELEHEKGAKSYLDCFRGHLRKRQLTGCILQAFQQLSGSK
jgi:SP family sugar:H+ symporter-like MFS transporter